MKKTVSIIIVLILCISCSGSVAERKTVIKDQYYIGAMRVVGCRDYVSLRSKADKTSKALAKVPPGAVVFNCSNNFKQYSLGSYKKQKELFIRCEYDGQEGYILKKYLVPAPEYEPAETRQDNNVMSREEVISSGIVVLDWQEFNMNILAAYEVVNENDGDWEYIRVGCFIDEYPIWGYTEAVKQTGQAASLKAFMGGTEDEPLVYVYDAEYGLTMLDIMDGNENWTLLKYKCPLGDAAVITVGENTGILYISGTEGPDPVAISAEGNILWRSEIEDPEVYGPMEIILNTSDIEVKYRK